MLADPLGKSRAEDVYDGGALNVLVDGEVGEAAERCFDVREIMARWGLCRL